MGKHRFIASGTTTKIAEKEVSENIRQTIEKQQHAIENELKERLKKANVELIEINKTIEKLENNKINLYIDNEDLNTLINESKKLVETIIKLPSNSIKRLNKICYTNLNNNKKIISNKLMVELKEIVKKHVYILARAQKRKIEQEKQQKKREEKKQKKKKKYGMK